MSLQMVTLSYADTEFCLRDVWAIGVITYFLLCGYTPFDRDSHVDEMEAILAADYKFEPADYWENVSDTGM